eukprot:3882529-Rhodomonas_salina.1
MGLTCPAVIGLRFEYGKMHWLHPLERFFEDKTWATDKELWVISTTAVAAGGAAGLSPCFASYYFLAHLRTRVGFNCALAKYLSRWSESLVPFPRSWLQSWFNGFGFAPQWVTVLAWYAGVAHRAIRTPGKWVMQGNSLLSRALPMKVPHLPPCVLFDVWD